MKNSAYFVGEWRVDPALHRVSRGDRSITLQPRTIELLGYFARHPGEVLTHDEILDAVWGRRAISDNVIYWNVNQLRSALQEDEGGEIYIETIPRRGYRLVAPVRAAPGAADAGSAAIEERRAMWRARLAFVAPLVALLLLLGAWSLLRAPAPVSKAHPASLAVLPFATMSEDPAVEHLADGLTEEILNAMAAIRELRVIARTSAFYYKGRDEDVRNIAETLNVSNIIEGSVRRDQGRIRVTVQLIDAETGHHRWSQTYERREADLFEVQQDIAFQVARALRLQLAPASRAQPAGGQPTSDVAALYREVEAIRRMGGGPEAFREAERKLEQILAIDPDYLPALSGLGRLQVLMISVFSNEFDARLVKAREVLERMRAHGYEDTAEYQLVEAVASRHEMSAYGITPERVAHINRAYERALELGPNDVTTYLSYAIHARRLGDLDKAAQMLSRGLQLDPLDVGINLQTARVYSATGRKDEALRRARSLVDHYPDNQLSYVTVAEVLASFGQFDEALSWLHQAPLYEDDRLIRFQLRENYFSLGDRDRAVDWLQRSNPSPLEDALVIGIQGDWSEAADRMERIARNRSSMQARQRARVADANFMAGRYERARFWYEASAPGLVEGGPATLNTQNYRTALKLAACLINLDQPDRAAALLKRLDNWLDDRHRLGFEGYVTTRAESLVLQDREAEALDELESLFDAGWQQLHGPWADAWSGEPSPILQALASSTRYRDLAARAAANLTAQRSRLAARLANRNQSERARSRL